MSDDTGITRQDEGQLKHGNSDIVPLDHGTSGQVTNPTSDPPSSSSHQEQCRNTEGDVNLSNINENNDSTKGEENPQSLLDEKGSICLEEKVGEEKEGKKEEKESKKEEKESNKEENEDKKDDKDRKKEENGSKLDEKAGNKCVEEKSNACQEKECPDKKVGCVENPKTGEADPKHLSIASEVASALANIGGVGNELKTAFKDVQSEFISVVSEVKSELSIALNNSQFRVYAEQEGDKSGDKDSSTQGKGSDKDSSGNTDGCTVSTVPQKCETGSAEGCTVPQKSGDKDSCTQGNTDGCTVSTVPQKCEIGSGDSALGNSGGCTEPQKCEVGLDAESANVDKNKALELREGQTSGDVGLQKDNSPLADCKKDTGNCEAAKGDENKINNVSDSCKVEGQGTPLVTPQNLPDRVTENRDKSFECVEKVYKFSTFRETSRKDFIKLVPPVAIAEEVTEELFGDDKLSEEVTLRTDNKVFCIETKGKEDMKFLSSETGEMVCTTQTVSAPSTPVPSSCKSVRKALRSQGVRGRRVSFPEDETHLISSYLEPVNPWQQMGGTSVEEIATAYKTSCDRHCTQPLQGVLQQIKALPLVLGGRVECLSLRGQKLDGSQCEGLEEIFRRVQFKALDLEGCYLDDDTAIPLFDMIEFYDSATQLNISCNEKIGFRGWQACSRMLKRTPSVEYLDARNTNLNETNMPILGRALRLGARLHTLHLESCNLTGRPLSMLTAALRQNDTLAELYLAENRLGVNDCIQLGNLVRANSTLMLLDLRNNNVQDAGCGHVCEGILEQQKLQQQQHQAQQQAQQASEGDTGSSITEKPMVVKGLKSLVLWNNHLTQQSANHLATMLGVTRALETLNLGRNNLTSEGVLRLKESLLRNHALLRLGLQAARVGDEGAVALAEYAADNTTIQHMDLRDNPVRVAGLMALTHSLRLNSTIIQLDIDSDPKSEPAAELAEQHASLQKEIKEICQRNLTQSHLRAAEQLIASAERMHVDKGPKEITCPSIALRKISLTCETTTSKLIEKTEAGQEEKQKYISPAPSPCPSPSPSPSPSPCASPVPSPQKNRFRVFKVSESSKSSPNLLVSQTSVTPVIPTVSQSGRSLSAGDLSQPAKQNVRPNRFSVGGRFTVTRVAEPSAPASLPSLQDKVSTMATLTTNTPAGSGPKIVISSPVRVERGFSVEDNASKADEKDDKPLKGDVSSPVNIKSVDLPEHQIQSDRFRLMSDGDNDVFMDNTTTPKTGYSECPSSHRSLNVYKNSVESQKSERDSDSLSSSDLTDSGFLDEGSRGSESLSPSPSSPHLEGDRDSLLSSSVDSTNQEDSGLGPPIPSSLPSILPSNIPFNLHDPPKRAPLAAMENGSFDSDSEDSELTTQSSDSTHSDEVRITAEQYQPKPAWGSKPEQVELPNNPELLKSGSSGSG